jgi:hypothetical protein
MIVTIAAALFIVLALIGIGRAIAAALDEKGALILAGWALIALIALVAFIADEDGIAKAALIAFLVWPMVVIVIADHEPKPRRTLSAVEEEEMRALPRLIKERIAQVGFTNDLALRRLFRREAWLEHKRAPTPEKLARFETEEALTNACERWSRRTNSRSSPPCRT